MTSSLNFLRKGLLDDPRLEALRERLGKSSKKGLKLKAVMVNHNCRRPLIAKFQSFDKTAERREEI